MFNDVKIDILAQTPGKYHYTPPQTQPIHGTSYPPLPLKFTRDHFEEIGCDVCHTATPNT